MYEKKLPNKYFIVFFLHNVRLQQAVFSFLLAVFSLQAIAKCLLSGCGWRVAVNWS